MNELTGWRKYFPLIAIMLLVFGGSIIEAIASVIGV